MARANKTPEDPRVTDLRTEIRALHKFMSGEVGALILFLGICYLIVRDDNKYNIVVGVIAFGMIVVAIVVGVACTNHIGTKRRELDELIGKKNPT